MSDKALFTYNPELFKDDENAGKVEEQKKREFSILKCINDKKNDKNKNKAEPK